MPRRFRITEENAFSAWRYLSAQLDAISGIESGAFWSYADFERRYGDDELHARIRAKDELAAVCVRGDGRTTTTEWQPERLNAWIETWLDERQRQRLMTALRVQAKRSRDGSAGRVSIDLNQEAHALLNFLTRFQGGTLSEVLIAHLEPERKRIWEAHWRIGNVCRALLGNETAKAWLHTPLAELDDQCPQEAMETAEGLERVRALIRNLRPTREISKAELEREAYSVFGSREATAAWIAKPLPGHGDKTPAALSQTTEGRQRLYAELVHGAFQ